MHQLELSLLQRAIDQSLSETEWRSLIDWELADPKRLLAFNIAPETIEQQLGQRLKLLRNIINSQIELPINRPILENLSLLWRVWLPLATYLVDIRRDLNRPLIQGILGGQGTGKTTLANILKILLQQMGYAAVCLSLDDLYKTYEERCQLRQVEPRLIWRGPPGTHDVELGIRLLEQIRQATADQVAIPRFDKAAYQGEGDRTHPELAPSPDMVLFEGWFVGVRPIDPAVFASAPAPIITADDRQFAEAMNDRLHSYLPLWEKLDRLMVLYPTNYRLSQQWRRQAEQQMKATGKTGMDDEKINQFVQYFWKALHPELFITPMLHQPEWVDLVIEIDANHEPIVIYKPEATVAK
jgi:D-glycerate 3-kinase